MQAEKDVQATPNARPTCAPWQSTPAGESEPEVTVASAGNKARGAALLPGPAAAALIAAAVLVACTSTKDALLQRGYPPAYAEGYEQGCASGKAAADRGELAAAQKDPGRQPGEGEYAQGWNAGFAACQRDRQIMLREAQRRRQSKDR
jgi:hypothetical protein